MILGTVMIVGKGTVNGIKLDTFVWFYCTMALISVLLPIFYLIKPRPIIITLSDFLLIAFCILGVIVTFLNIKTINTSVVILILVTILYFYFKLLFYQYRLSYFILVLCFISTGLFEAIFGMIQLYGYASSYHLLFGITGSFENPGPYAGYLAMIFPLAGYYVIKDRRLVSIPFDKRYFPFYLRFFVCVLTVVGVLLILPATMSRTSWVSASVGLFFIYFALRFYSKRKSLNECFLKWKLSSILWSLVCLIILSITLLYVYRLKQNSADGRILIWKIALQTANNNKSGVGLGRFAGAYGKEQSIYFESGVGNIQEQYVADSPEYAFNDYLQISIEFGMVPFLLLVIIILSSIYFGLKYNAKIGIIGGFLSLLTFASMSYPLNLLPFLIAFVFLLAVLNHQRSVRSSGTIITIKYFALNIYLPPLKTGSVLILLIFFWSSIAYSLYFIHPAYDAHNRAEQARLLYHSGRYKDASKQYAEIIPHLEDNVSVLFEYSRCLNKIGEYEQSNKWLRKASNISGDPMIYNIMGKNYQSMNKYKSAEYCFQHASNIVPNRIYPHYLMAILYFETGSFIEAHEKANFILGKTPKVESESVRKMKSKMKEILEFIVMLE